MNTTTPVSPLRWLYNLFTKRLTPVGRAYFVLLLGFGLGGASNFSIPLYIPWMFFALMMVVSTLSSIKRRKQLHVQRLHVPNGTAGKTLSYDIKITNQTNRTQYQLDIMEWRLPFTLPNRREWTPSQLSQLNAGESQTLRQTLYCPKRGAYHLSEIGVLSAFPLGLWNGLARYKQQTPFLVYPAFRKLTSFEVPTGRQHQPGGILLSSDVGDSSEFMHTRDYKEGDNPRHIHWASWARQNKPVIKVYQEEYFVRLALLLDSEWDQPTEPQAFESALSLAASIADVLSHQDYIIDVFAAGEDIHHFQAGRSLAHLEHILEILACLNPSATINWATLSAELLPKSTQLTAVIALFLDWDTPRRQLIQQLHKHDVATRVLVLRDEETTLPLPTHPPLQYMKLPVHTPQEGCGLSFVKSRSTGETR
ncbi:MAG TPA: hypothetical protein DCE42_25835 [Myxococcales bacterium]|nr:hypothetical protein [Deltaproteobacteria bacterium]HAA58211.1 hypothetical protein [Myxococcales bacterium]